MKILAVLAVLFIAGNNPTMSSPTTTPTSQTLPSPTPMPALSPSLELKPVLLEVRSARSGRQFLPKLAANVVANLVSNPAVIDTALDIASEIAEKAFGGNVLTVLPSLAKKALNSLSTHPTVLKTTLDVASSMAEHNPRDHGPSVLPGLSVYLMSSLANHPTIANATLDIASKSLGAKAQSTLPRLALDTISSLSKHPKVINATLNLATKMAKKSLGHDGWVYSKSFLNGISPIWKRDEKDTLADLSELDISVSSCIIQVSPMCAVTSGGIGGFTTGHPNFKIKWNDESGCRSDIRNVDDHRPAYDQELPAPSLSATINFELESHRNAISQCGPFVKTLLKPGTFRVPLPPRRGTRISEKVSAGYRMLAWKGLTWWTPLIINSCIFDSFFTYMVLKLKLNPSYIERNFLIPQDPAEAVFRVIYDIYSKEARDPTDDAIKKYSQNFKRLWIMTFFPEYKDNLKNNKVINFKGNEYKRVITHLNPSSVMYLTGSCKCQLNGQLHITATKAQFLSIDLGELKHLARETGNPLQKNPLANPWYEDTYRKQQKSCNGCSTKVQLDYIFTPTTTWFLYFQFNQLTQVTNPVPDISKIPKKVQAVELFELDKMATFELGYISCTTSTLSKGLTHHLSFQFFNGKFYYYDDMKGGGLIYAPDPNLTIMTKVLIVRDVVYFRP